MNELPGTPSSLQQPYHVIQLRIPVLSREGKVFFGVIAGVAALGLATWAGWSGHAHHIAAMTPAPSAPVETVAPVSSMPALPTSVPNAVPALPQVQNTVTAPPREEPSTTIYAVQPPAAPAPAPAPVAQPAAPVQAAAAPKLTSSQMLADAIENQAAATGQSPSQVIQSLNPGNPPPAPSSVVVTAPQTQTVVVPTPVAYSYPYYYGYPYYGYGGYGPYWGGTSLSLYFGSHGRIGGGFGFHR